ncbi:relaxosome protein TraM, partial [Escherichia coli]|nr:relaxosome protein TraM [Escherichia coli]
MAKVQAYVSDEIVYKINKIVERRRAEGAKSTDVSFSSISTMLLELGHCCKVSDEAAFCLIQRPYISKTLLT